MFAKDYFVSLAVITQSWLTGWGFGESVFGAVAMKSKSNATSFAAFGIVRILVGQNQQDVVSFRLDRPSGLVFSGTD